MSCEIAQVFFIVLKYVKKNPTKFFLCLFVCFQVRCVCVWVCVLLAVRLCCASMMSSRLVLVTNSSWMPSGT